jgi:hypothetical protein
VNGRATLLPLAALIAATVSAPPAAAAADACVVAYEKAQEEKIEGRLRAARTQLHSCVQASCPAFVRADCIKWLDEVEAAVPTVVFVARLAGRDLIDVKVRTAGGEELAAKLDGRAVRVDPGRQAFVFESRYSQPATVEILVVEGQKNRLVEATLTSIAGAGTLSGSVADESGGAPTRSHWLRRHRFSLALAGVSALGLAGFVTLGESGARHQDRLEKSCAPTCAPAQVSTLRTRYLLADISLGISIGSLAAAAYLYYRESTRDAAAAASPAPAPDRARLSWSLSGGPYHGALVVGTTF